MPVPSSITDLTSVAASNSPPGSESVFPELDGYLRAHASFIKQNYDSLSAKASTADLSSKANVTSPAFVGTATFSAVAVASTATFGTSASWSVDSTYLRNRGNSQPMFFAHASGAGDQSAGATVSYATELTDQGAIFDTTNSRFTAPVAGVYSLKATVLLRNDNASSIIQELALVGSTAGTFERALEEVPGSGGTRQFKLSAIIRLAAAEVVTVRAILESFAGGRTVVYKSWASMAVTFSGALLY